MTRAGALCRPGPYHFLPDSNRSQVTRGVVLMLLSSLAYALSFTTVRELSERFSVYQLVLFRTSLGTAVMLPWLFRQGFVALRTRRWKLYVFRALLVYTANLCWFYALAHMDLADATTLSFLGPLIAVLILAAFVGEGLGRARVFALLMGFAGALLIIRPGFSEVGPEIFAALYMALGYGIATAVIRALTMSENTNAIVFYMFALNLVLALAPGIVHWRPPVWSDAPWILAFGVLSLLAQLFMTRSLACAEAAVVMPTYYLQLPLVALLGFLVFDQRPGGWLLPGALLIVGGSYVSVWGEFKVRRAPRQNPR